MESIGLSSFPLPAPPDSVCFHSRNRACCWKISNLVVPPNMGKNVSLSPYSTWSYTCLIVPKHSRWDEDIVLYRAGLLAGHVQTFPLNVCVCVCVCVCVYIYTYIFTLPWKYLSFLKLRKYKQYRKKKEMKNHLWPCYLYINTLTLGYIYSSSLSLCMYVIFKLYLYKVK